MRDVSRGSLRTSPHLRGGLVLALVLAGLGGCTVESEPDGGVAVDARPFDAGSDAGPGYAVFFDEGLEPSVIERFESASPSDEVAPTILYPADGTLVPPNLRGIDVHFTGRAFDTFEVRFAQGGAPSVVAYVWCRPVASGCLFQPWSEVWDALAARRSAGPFEIRMRGLAGTAVSEWSEPSELELAQEDIAGALYFWSTDPPSIRRYDFALGRRSSELFLSGAEEETCIGCHAISHDGTRIALGVYDAEQGFRARVYDVATRTQVFPSEIDAPLPAYGPAADILVSGSPPPADGVDRPLQIISGSDGSLLDDLGVTGVSADWSADGDRIVFDGATGSGARELQLLARSTEGWQSAVVLATPDTEREHSPSFAPDSEWIGYAAHRGSAPVLTVMRLADGTTRDLVRATAGMDATWLRWNPHPYQERGRRLFWVTFSSGRGYGAMAAGARQIWMAAFDPEADPADPSRPAFRFPAQRAGVDNFIGEWTLTVQRQPCDTDADCPDGELCQDGFCFPEGPE